MKTGVLTIHPGSLLARLAGICSMMCDELAPFPGRSQTTWRYVVACATVILIAQTLQVHFLAISLIVVFFTLQENTVLTRLSGVRMILGTTIAVALSLLLIKYFIDIPLLRIVGACILAMSGMYFMRISKYGSMGYLIALWITYSQSILDTYDNPEMITRLILWFWVAVTFPIIIAMIVNYFFLPAHPGRLLNDELNRQLDEINIQLESKKKLLTAPHLSLNSIERGILTLHKHLTFATLGEREYQSNQAFHLMRITSIDRLHTAAAQLSQLVVNNFTTEQLNLIQKLQNACRDLKCSIENGQKFTFAAEQFSTRPALSTLDITLYEMIYAFQAASEITRTQAGTIAAQKTSSLVPDAFTNPVYLQFALKTILATLFCYLVYTAVQWPGIHTSMLTCIIMALPGLGATLHKGILRIIGCIAGSVVALIATVFIIPHLDTITGLLMLLLPMIAIGSWVAAGSARTNYIGVQFVFAFALALLGRFGPSTDIVEIRDRLIGILFGIVVSLIVSITLWPEREGAELRNMLARLLRSMAALARAGDGIGTEMDKRKKIDQARLQGWALLTKNREMQARVALEPGWQYAHNSITIETQNWLVQAQELLFAINWLQTLLQHTESAFPKPLMNTLKTFREYSAKRLDQLANSFEGKQLIDKVLTPPDLDSLLAQARDNGNAQTEEIITAVQTIYQRIVQLDEHITPSVNPLSRLS